MRINDNCAECLYDKQQHLTDDQEYLDRVKRFTMVLLPERRSPAWESLSRWLVKLQ